MLILNHYMLMLKSWIKSLVGGERKKQDTQTGRLFTRMF